MRSLIALLASLALPAAASAATLSILPSSLTYNVGDTVTLTVIGDGQGAVAYSIYGKILYDPALMDPIATNQVIAGPGWISGVLQQGDGYAEVFNQIAYPNATTASNFPGTIAVVTLIAQAVGIVNIGWDSNLTFFDRTTANTAGASFCIGIDPCPVPEPSTHLLTALGLVALSVAAKRRSW